MAQKAIGGKASDMLTFFALREPPAFKAEEAAAYLRVSRANAYPILSRLVRRAWLSRSSRGIYEVAPAWATAEQPYVPDRFSALASLLADRRQSYVAFFSAFELHDLLSQPAAGRMWVAVAKPRRPVRVAGNRVVWVVTEKSRFEWGIEKRWMGSRSFGLSDLERTLLDGLHLPRHVGGISIVAGALQRAQSRIDSRRLLAHAEVFGIEAVRRRLGYLLETVLPGSALTRSSVRRLLPRTAGGRAPVLDPGLPATGEIHPRWSLRVNISREDLLSEGAS